MCLIVPLLVFYKNNIGIEESTKVDVPLKEIKPTFLKHIFKKENKKISEGERSRYKEGKKYNACERERSLYKEGKEIQCLQERERSW